LKKFAHVLKSVKMKIYSTLSRSPIIGDWFALRAEKEALEFHAYAAQETDVQHRRWLLKQSIGILGDNTEHLRQKAQFAEKLMKIMNEEREDAPVLFEGFIQSDREVASTWTKAYQFQQIWDENGLLDALTFSAVSSSAWRKIAGFKQRVEKSFATLINKPESILASANAIADVADEYHNESLDTVIQKVVTAQAVASTKISKAEAELAKAEKQLKEQIEEAKTIVEETKVEAAAAENVATSNPAGTREDIEAEKAKGKSSRRRKAQPEASA